LINDFFSKPYLSLNCKALIDEKFTPGKTILLMLRKYKIVGGGKAGGRGQR
jgi:hypothetical protein